MTVNAIRVKLEKANEEIPPDRIAAFYWYGRLIDIAVNFDPIDMDDDALAELDSWDGLNEQKETKKTRQNYLSTDLLRHSAINPPVVGQSESVNSTDLTEASNSTLNTTNGTEEAKKPFNQVWAFTIGLLNSSFGKDSPNAEVCHSNVSRIVNHSVDFIEDVQIATNQSLNQSATDFEHILASIYPITYSCYHTIFDVKDVTMIYLASFSSFERVLFNLMHKVGLIFDTIWWIIKHHQTFDELTVTEADRDLWWYKCGSYYGMVFK